MDEFSSRTYGTSGLDNRPLFGETSARVITLNIILKLTYVQDVRQKGSVDVV